MTPETKPKTANDNPTSRELSPEATAKELIERARGLTAADHPSSERLLIRHLADALEEAEQERAELQAGFDLRWGADMRAIKRWRETGPGRELTLPDQADLCVWLLEERDQALAEVRRLTDLVRHQRMELHAAELITDTEYDDLAQDHPAVARLETYDGLRAENRKLRGVLEDICRWSAGNGRYEWATSIARRAAEALRAEPAGEGTKK